MDTTENGGEVKDDRYIVWFDIDNTLYSSSSRISHAMGERIHAYFVTLGLADDEASDLHLRYYTQYGLALRGLVRHHDVDPLDFDRNCDGALPLEEMLQPHPSVRKLLQDIDRTKARVWALTNAYQSHAKRVLRILELDDLIEGLVFCDYGKENFSCKPEDEYYHEALAKANITDPSKCLFVDDSKINVNAAKRLGWGSCVHFVEVGLEVVEGGQTKTLVKEDKSGVQDNGVTVIHDLQDLRTVWSFIFKS